MKQFTRPDFNLLKEEKSNSYGEFMVEPLERGFGTTLGNAIRRTLLAATPGAAVYAIKLDGAPHEFMSLPGIVENVSRIVLNIKQLVLKIDPKMYGDEEVKLKIKTTTPGDITAGDIEVPAGVEILNKDLHIATLSDGGVFDLTLYAKNGRGYKSFKENKEEVKEVGLITIDSNYSPVTKVAYHVEPTKIGRSIDLEKLIIEVTTDGSITPVTAISIAAKVLVAHLEYFVDLNQEINDLEIIGVEEEDNQELDESIDDLDFTQRSLNCLKRAGIETLRDLVSRSEDEIQEIRNLGRKSFKEIKDKVSNLGLNFKQD
ncbi:DNA-directed RNA polymerase subunit alpha [Mesoplasma lactucae]|uniref:DNA-directed RNA polymerase subunit alpha n=1 Tax=Mesoplasma lactucae ATCC 49193 TaxID=81460 RepID=A0A291IQJ4_9MOLU|nr:DNA-directed RNA polymerase subunit alpha [Mesoplasma lactucae]ATG97195.1 DNA-directed RNA polymerase subunit alpha [Mesoplasma lactucae ATCC 49193]ATZ20364.1 DNA-directed RNA polymerase subunit alpha [Mesoplasma lactucae ATCC 49193]MCL8216535.1 DNA-directed RNA polymerase subunit alpha [Mesoplasma lactucae ATCC 49193]